MVLAVGCGELSNEPIAAALVPTDATVAEPCSAQRHVALGPHALPPATAGRAWTGSLHATADPAGTVRWAVGQLPAGLSFVAEHGLLVGRPESPGTFPIEIAASLASCPDARAKETIQIEVAAPCESDCGAPPACEPQLDDTLVAYVDGVEAGGSFAADHLRVRQVNVARPPAADTTHQLVLENIGSRGKESVVVNYTLPGGVRIPLAAGTDVSLRYLRGTFGDHYLFISRDGYVRFVAYDGFLGREELARICPGGDGSACPLPTFRTVPSDGPQANGCGERRRVGIDLQTSPLRSSEITTQRIVPGEVGELPDKTLLRLVDAWEQAGATSCDPGYPALERVTFYVLPLGPCTFAEIRPEAAPGAAPTAASFAVRVMYPSSPTAVRAQWVPDPPTDKPLAQPCPVEGPCSVDMPLAGTYRLFLTASTDVDLAGSGPTTYAPCLAPSADVVIAVAPANDARVELLWTPTSLGIDARPTLLVGETEYSQATPPGLIAVDLALPETRQHLSVHYYGDGATMDGLVRVWRAGALVCEKLKRLDPGGNWQIGDLDSGPFDPTGDPCMP